MDSQLRERLEKIHEHIELLSSAEETFFFLDAHKKVLYSQLYLKADGKNISEKEACVYSSDEWRTFAESLAEAQVKMNKARREYELKIKAYDASHLSYKIENQAIVRQ